MPADAIAPIDPKTTPRKAGTGRLVTILLVVALIAALAACALLAVVAAQPKTCPITEPQIIAQTEALEPFIAARDAAPTTFSTQQLAGMAWFTTFISALSVSDVPIAQGGTFANCRHLLRNQYAHNATVDLQLPNGNVVGLKGDTPATLFGFPESTFTGINVLPLSDCVLFDAVDHWDGFMGQSGIINVEYCPTSDGKGIWKGQDVPFKNAANNSLGVPGSWFEDVGRYMYMKGHLTPEGHLIADQLTMCIGGPCVESKIEYAEWNC